MTKEEALKLCEKHLVVWQRYKKDSTTTDNSPSMWGDLNLVHRFVYGQFENLGCSDCYSSLFRKVYRWYEAEINGTQKVETKSVFMAFPEQEKPLDLSGKTYQELINIAREKKIPTERNIAKAKLITLIQNHK